MIRKPSSFQQLYSWHRDYMAGRDCEIHDGIAECGWYKMRRVPGGPWVAVEIVCERITDDAGDLIEPERLMAVFDGERWRAETVWTYLTPISKRDFDALKRRTAADPAMAATLVAMDLSKKPVRPPRSL